jgi:transcriptional regulator with PAS, ATPase and Fis domain
MINNMKAQTSNPVETNKKLPGHNISKKPLVNSLTSNRPKQKADMDECDQVDDALKESEIRYRRLFESAKDGILILNATTGQITDVNPFLSNLLGYSHEELL